MSISNLNRPRDAFEELDSGSGAGHVHIRIQQRTGRKSITTVQGIGAEYDLRHILRCLKKEHSCNGTIVDHPEYGDVIQLSGDQRQNVRDFLIKVGIMNENYRVHGF